MCVQLMAASTFFTHLFDSIYKCCVYKPGHMGILNCIFDANNFLYDCLVYVFLKPLWRAAVAQFERLMMPSEQEVAGRLKSYIADVQDNPQQVVKRSFSSD